MQVKGPAAKVAAILAAAAIAVPVIAHFEGYEPVGYRDPAPGAFETICYGHMERGVLGKRYSPEKCAELLAEDAVKHGIDIAACLPEKLPNKTRAAFTATAYNIGVGGFCGSSMARKARAGDLRGACDALMLWTKAGGKELRGLVRRRAAERELCLQGVREG
ncbi:lysozyme [Phenylobacterium sp. J367]|uniref:lysozyme n=1 Tax=Phenylobacterium sp. J367 TaxID=2898435 RepID=UPI002151CE96|nr:lysozyme [Phenylobacterium sp. J367]MCR5876983.1 lysozyme [Phenylobacterium sp. J367]MCR5881181.1 lysozyme [Phenylobacterium sp. J367]